MSSVTDEVLFVLFLLARKYNYCAHIHGANNKKTRVNVPSVAFESLYSHSPCGHLSWALALGYLVL